jgi:hypothetical protein
VEGPYSAEASKGKEGVSIIPPVIDFDPDSVAWDYAWDFTDADNPYATHASSSPADALQATGYQLPALTGNAFPFDGCMYFDGKSRLELPNSADQFEEGPFTVYVEWKPENSTDNFQQIVGHYNWELLQNKESVSFQVGRMDDAQGLFYSVFYPITDPATFFNTKHSALAVYSPSDTNGYIDLFVDNNFVGRSYFATSTIWTNYNGTKNLTFGMSEHGAANYFSGCLRSARIDRQIEILSTLQIINFPFNSSLNDQIKVPLGSSESKIIQKVNLYGIQK